MRFDHAALVTKLATLPTSSKVLFTAAVAERLFPRGSTFFEQRQPELLAQLRAGLDLLWGFGAGEPWGEVDRAAALEACVMAMDLASDADSDDASFAEDAAAAIAYGLQAMVSDDPNEPAWAAQRAYDSVDHFVLMRMDDLDVEWTEQEILAHPAIQRELRRQGDALAFLEASRGEAQIRRDEVTALRGVAEDQALTMFSD